MRGADRREVEVIMEVQFHSKYQKFGIYNDPICSIHSKFSSFR